MRSATGLAARLPIPGYEAVVVTGMVVAFAVFLAACFKMSSEMPLVVFVPILCLLGFIAAVVVARAATGSVPAIIAVLAVLVFLTNGNFRVRDNAADISLDWQSLLKFIVWIACGMAGLPHLPQVKRILDHWGATLWLGYICFALVSVFYAPSPTISFGYALSLLCFYIFTFALAEKLSEATILWTITLTLAVFFIISWIVVYADPDLGLARDLPGAERRMGGIAGQPNSLGSVCAIYLGTVFVLAWKRYCRLVPALSLAALGYVTLMASDSRTSLIAVAAGMLAVIVSRSIWLLAGMGLAATLALVGTLSFPEQLEALGTSMSRSGDANEMVTLTGRTQIWEFTWQKILESPIFGWGYNSSKVILTQHIGFANGLIVDQAHNLLLQNLLSVGFIGTLPLIGLFLKLVVDIARGRPAPLSVLFLVMVFVNGISDPAALGGSPTVLTLMFILASLSPWTPSNSLRRPAPAKYFTRRKPCVVADGGSLNLESRT
jgi:O-antigen ligase